MTGYDPRYGFELNYGDVPPATPRVPLRQRRSVRRVLKWGGVCALAVAMTVFGLRFYWSYVAQAAVDSRATTLDRMDPHWRWEEILTRRAVVD